MICDDFVAVAHRLAKQLEVRFPDLEIQGDEEATLRFLVHSFRSIGQRDLSLGIGIMAFAFHSRVTHRFVEGMQVWAELAAARMQPYLDYLEGKEPPGRKVLDSILWCTSPDLSSWLAVIPYDEFLLTPYWKCIRELVLERDGRQCRNCTATTGLQCHHRTYEHRGREHEHLDDLTILCADCHAKFHR